MRQGIGYAVFEVFLLSRYQLYHWMENVMYTPLSFHAFPRMSSKALRYSWSVFRPSSRNPLQKTAYINLGNFTLDPGETRGFIGSGCGFYTCGCMVGCFAGLAGITYSPYDLPHSSYEQWLEMCVMLLLMCAVRWDWRSFQVSHMLNHLIVHSILITHPYSTLHLTLHIHFTLYALISQYRPTGR